jgi:hypothetical protein
LKTEQMERVNFYKIHLMNRQFQNEQSLFLNTNLESLILAQDERWRRA